MQIIQASGLKILAKSPFEKATPDMKFDLRMLKDETQIDLWKKRVGGSEKQFKQVLELGISHGGSIPYIFDLCAADFIVGVDISKENVKAVKAINRSALKDKYKLYFETDQTDSRALNAITEKHFPAGLDLIIDDASHLLHETRRSFEILFPKLSVGGYYVIEDHRWGHIEGFKFFTKHGYVGKPSMLQILFEIGMYFATHPEAIGSIAMDSNTITVTRGEAAIEEPFSLEASTVNWAGYDLEKLTAIYKP